MTITIVGGGNPSGPTYPLQRSVRLRGSASAYFSRSAYPVSGAGTKWTMSMWLKRGALSSQSDFFTFVSTTGSAQQAGIQFDSNGAIRWWQYAGAGGYQFQKVTTAVFRDPSAWYHFVFVYDTTLATATDRCQIWINGVRQTSFSTSTDPSLNLVTYYNTGTLYPYLGAENRNASSALNPFDGYLAEVNFIDGQALTPTSFGAYNSFGVWSPAKYSGSYGTNGFYLNFQDNSGATATTIGKDSSGNGNNWTPNNISVTAGVTYDSMLDVPTLTSVSNANFAVLSQVDKNPAITLAQGNLSYTASNNRIVKSTISVNSGKWYWEFISGNGATGSAGCGIVSDLVNIYAAVDINTSSSGVAYRTDGNKSVNGTSSAYGSSYTSSNVIGIALDCDTNSITFYRDNTSQGAISITSGLNWFAAFDQAVGTNYVNFGQRPFTYTPPTGFKSLNTFNLPTPTIPNGAAQFAATLYTGNGGTQVITNTVNGVSMQPDLVWIKGRSGATNNGLQDSVRGTAGGILVSNSTAAESAGGAYISSLNSNGFTVNANSSGNGSTATYVGWQWKANGTPAVTNTSGSIPSTISVNPTAGFSIVTWTGTGAAATIGHGLGVAPSMIIWKYRSAVSDWAVGHNRLNNGSSPWSYWLALNTTAAQAASSGPFNNTAPTSTVFSVGSFNAVSTTMVAYCFSEIAGFSKFGGWTGNGSTDGPFIYTGFRPRFILIKDYGNPASNWIIQDTSVNTYNVAANILSSNSSAAETTYTGIDFLSNGFKVRVAGAPINTNGNGVLYAAFAENPFNYSLAR